MGGKSVEFLLLAALTLSGLANLAVRAGSGCPPEGFKKARK
jgi:hypothetical protein